jgi:opacity protein-like surface antigen
MIQENIVYWKTACTALLTLLLTTLASAQIPTSGNIFLGYSYAHADLDSSNTTNLNGWEGSLEGRIFPHVGIVADLSGHYGADDLPLGCSSAICQQVHANTSVYSVLFGPQVSVSVGRIAPFAHVLAGVGHVSASAPSVSDSDTSLATAVGGGLDYKLIHSVAWRAQMDLLHTHFFSNGQNDFRFSTGLAFHF